MNTLLTLILVLLTTAALAEPPKPDWPQVAVMSLPKTSLVWYRNPDGSCVQCSNGMVGAYHCDFVAATLLWGTEYGSAERGGSGPDRVARYCRERGIEVYNVTGRSFEDTKPWHEWAAKTGRFAATGCFGRHFQTFWGRDYKADRWIIMNNWDGLFDTPYVYTEEQFARQHNASGAWIVIPKRPPPAPDPVYVAWWN